MNRKIMLTGLTTLVVGGLLLTPSVWAYRGDPNIQGPNYSPERHEAMSKAFNNNDYNAWKKLMNGRGRVSQVVNKDNFTKFAQAHKLMLEGKKAEATKIRTELGLGLGKGHGYGMGRGSK